MPVKNSIIPLCDMEIRIIREASTILMDMLNPCGQAFIDDTKAYSKTILQAATHLDELITNGAL